MTEKEAMARCWAEVDLDNLIGNYKSACAASPDATVIPVIKADAYGCGAAVVAMRLSAEGARFFAVATASEAVEVKNAVTADVLVLGMPGEQNVDACIEKGIILTAYSPDSAKLYSARAVKLKKNCRVHMKVNTGLNRLGFDRIEELKQAAALKGLTVEGIYTHLAFHGEASDIEQFALFDKACEAVNAPMKHMLDSIGLFLYPERRYNAVRIGAYLYGVDSKTGEPSKSVVSLYARVAQTHTVKKGGLVGYDDDHTLSRDTVIATVSAGYVDGYPRKSDVSQVEIRGKRAKVLGLVCMDQMMVDVTDIPGVMPGDVVTLLGGSISLREFSSWWDLNRNEALARIGPRTPRVYKYNGLSSVIGQSGEHSSPLHPLNAIYKET